VSSIQHYVIVCQWLAACRWFYPGTPVSSTKKTDCHDITEILLKVALNTIILKSSVESTFSFSPLIFCLDCKKIEWIKMTYNILELTAMYRHKNNHLKVINTEMNIYIMAYVSNYTEIKITCYICAVLNVLKPNTPSLFKIISRWNFSRNFILLLSILESQKIKLINKPIVN
jgi:hypothetical protein